MGWRIRPGQCFTWIQILSGVLGIFLVDSTPVIWSGVGTKKTGQVRSRWVGQDLSEMPDSGVGHTHDNRTGSRFTNTAVPSFDGRGCWQQHLLIVQAISKSNGWSEATAALQLFAHLDGEAFNVALLMPVKEREQWEDLSNGLSEYYNSPGRLAVSGGDSRVRVGNLNVGIWTALLRMLPSGR